MRFVSRIAVVLGIGLLATLAPFSPRSGHHDPAALASTNGAVATLPGTKVRMSGTNTCWRPRTAEVGFLRKTNAARQSEGHTPLRLDPELSRAARYHTWQMAHKNLLFHTPSDRLRRRVTHWVILGENVGVGGGVDSLQTAFMNSPEHKANIMLPGFTHVGVGTTSRGDTMWVTVLFVSVTNPGTPLRMPSC
jgi:uncharacterized protein YkwD